jgi:hypothetical protein
MLLADIASQGDLNEGRRLRPHIEGWRQGSGRSDLMR